MEPDMIGFFVYALTAPFYYSAKALGRSGRSYRRVPRYRHGYCTIGHLSPGAADRCAQTAAYKRIERAAIVEERRRADDAAIAAAMKRARQRRLAKERGVSGSVMTDLLGTAVLLGVMVGIVLVVVAINRARTTSPDLLIGLGVVFAVLATWWAIVAHRRRNRV
jgi:hypothetical protein